MHLKPSARLGALILALGLGSGAASAQTADPDTSGAGGSLQSPSRWEADFLLNYYEQDGENSPVTGGIGTEELDVIAPVVVVRWNQSDDWQFQAQVGVDSITSASTDNMDLGEVQTSSASRVDSRAFTSLTLNRSMEKQNLAFTLGFSGEYDYKSIQAGVDWSRSFRSENTTLSAGLRHYSDTIELYEIDGVQRGEDDRTTTDLSLGLTQVLGKKTVLSLELFASDQSGFLSTPFHEVILTDGSRVAERLPDNRLRTALGLRLRHAFTDRVVGRLNYRFYDDDWNIQAHTLELEPHFRVSSTKSLWVFPILRYHSQDASDYFGLPATFDGSEAFFTADRELSEFTSEKIGAGMVFNLVPGRRGWAGRIRWFEARVANYSRDDGLDAFTLSLGLGMSF